MDNTKLGYLLMMLVWCLRQDITNAAHTMQCPKGTYLHEADDTSLCMECPHETFMPWQDHEEKKCFDCTKIENATVEILIKPCDRFHDADIQCVEGYYRHLARNLREKTTCLACIPACPKDYYQVHPCQNFSNLGCCPGKNYDYIVSEKGLRMCRSRPAICLEGQYLDTTLNDCKPCPENTFMPEDYHSFTECWDCHYLSNADLPLHAVITQPCTSTQPPRYGCKEGYYVNHDISHRGDDIYCSPCHICDQGKYVGRECDMYHDTVCCEKPDMSVVDGAQGELLCVEKVACKDGSYNPPDCDKTCSQHCRPSERSDVSLCDNNNGICLFGCVDGYTGDMCETVQVTKDGNDAGLGTASLALLCALVLVLILVTICVMFNKLCPGSGPKWLQNVVHGIFTQYEKAPPKDIEQDALLKKESARSAEEHVHDQYRLANDTLGTELRQRRGRSESMRENSTGRQGYSIHSLKEEVQTKVKQLKSMTVFHTQNGIDCLTYIYQTFSSYRDERQVIGNLLADLGYAETCIDILHKELNDPNLQEIKWQVVDVTISVCGSYSSVSSKFAMRLAGKEAVQFMSTILRQKRFLDNLDKQGEEGLVKACVAVLSNIADHIGKIQAFKESTTNEVLMHLTTYQNESIKFRAMVALVQIVGEDELNRLTADSNIIQSLVQGIRKAIEDDSREYEDYTASKLTQYLARLAVDHDSKTKMVEEGILDLCLTMLRHNDTSEQTWAADCLGKMASDDIIRPKIQNTSYLVPALEDLKETDQGRVRIYVKQALQVIKGEKEPNLDDITQTIKTAVEKLKQMTDYHSKDAVKCQRVIGQAHWDYLSYSTHIGDLLGDFDYPATCMKILRKEMSKKINLEDDDIWAAVFYSGGSCWNYSFFSETFAKRLAETNVVQFATKILEMSYNLDYLHRERERRMIECGLNTLLHIAVHVGNIQAFSDCNTFEVLMPYTNSESKDIQESAIAALAWIVKGKEKDRLADKSATVTTILHWVDHFRNNKDDSMPVSMPRGIMDILLTHYMIKRAVDFSSARK